MVHFLRDQKPTNPAALRGGKNIGVGHVANELLVRSFATRVVQRTVLELDHDEAVSISSKDVYLALAVREPTDEVSRSNELEVKQCIDLAPVLYDVSVQILFIHKVVMTTPFHRLALLSAEPIPQWRRGADRGW